MTWLVPRMSGGTALLDAPVVDAPSEHRPARSLRERLGLASPTQELERRPQLAQAVASHAVSAFRSQVLGMRCGAGPDRNARVMAVFRSAHSASEPTNLVIWVLLADVDQSRIPAWWDPSQVLADPQLTAWAMQLRAAALGHLVAADWPDAERTTVLFDSAHRVEHRGGWRYFG
jgi:hypothetical protein